MHAISKFLIFFALACLLKPTLARAMTYEQALEAYSDQKFARSYKAAMEVAHDETGTRRGKALMLAAAAALELDQELRARALYQRALEDNSSLELPDVVRSKRALRFFADIREGKDPGRFTRVEAAPVFNRYETYLPFGINQILQGKPLLGAAFGGVQAFALYNAREKYAAADKAEREGRDIRRKALQTGDDINPVVVKFINKSKNTVKRSDQEAQLSLVLAAAAYVGSVLEAGYYPAGGFFLSHASGKPEARLASEPAESHFRLDLFNPLMAHQGLQLTWSF